MVFPSTLQEIRSPFAIVVFPSVMLTNSMLRSTNIAGAIVASALALSLLSGLTLRLVGFTVSGTPQRRVQRALWGAIGILVLYYPVAEMLKLALPRGAGVTIACVLETCFVTLVMPWLALRLEQRTETRSDRM